MPIYEFVCERCGHRFERLVASTRQSAGWDCPQCRGSTRRAWSVFAAHTRGTAACGQRPQDCSVARQGGCGGGSCPLSG
ncbi:MAG: zinc ribbon domain-containing protein [Sedimentisphaerales bacterium]|nr:zinc ribbon domain-containing protein [Sedimentisphaerales bacterium]